MVAITAPAWARRAKQIIWRATRWPPPAVPSGWHCRVENPAIEPKFGQVAPSLVWVGVEAKCPVKVPGAGTWAAVPAAWAWLLRGLGASAGRTKWQAAWTWLLRGLGASAGRTKSQAAWTWLLRGLGESAGRTKSQAAWTWLLRGLGASAGTTKWHAAWTRLMLGLGGGSAGFWESSPESPGRHPVRVPFLSEKNSNSRQLYDQPKK
jgi:hypothetical protein